MTRPSLAPVPCCLLLLMLALPGCSNDSTAPGEKLFALELTIEDPLGRPVAGLEAKLHVPIPGFPVSAAKPRTTVQFSIPEAAHINLSAYDLEGRLAHTLWDANLAAGQRVAVVGGGEDPDFLVGSRIYRYELVATVAGVETFRDSKYMSLYTSIDVDQQPVLGVSDRDGNIRCTDKTQFPFLYGLGPQPWIDENGNPAGTFEFEDLVGIRLYDPVADLYMNHEVLIGEGRNSVELVWDVTKAMRGRDGDEATPARALMFDVPTGAVIPPLEYELRQNVPNPFN